MELTNETNIDGNLLKQNSRLRKEIATYQSALEEMEVRCRAAEQTVKSLRKKFGKLTGSLNDLLSETVELMNAPKESFANAKEQTKAHVSRTDSHAEGAPSSC